MSHERAPTDPAVKSKALTEELHASEARFHQLVDAVTDYAIFMLDATGHVTTWNVGAQRNKGYAAQEVIGQHFSIFYTPEDRASGRPDSVLAAVRRDGRFEDEGWRVRKDGTRFWANVVITSLRDEAGMVSGFAKVTRDLTAKRDAEAHLRASEARFHQLVDAVTDYAIFMLDATGHVTTWNVGAQRNKGYAAQEVIGQHFSIFYTPEDRASGRPDSVLAAVSRDGRFEEEGWRVRKDGTKFWANVVITPLRDEAGLVSGFAKVTRDLTARREADDNQRALVGEQLARESSELARKEMERVGRIKDEFLATMSHELRTPLNAITGWAAILRAKPRDETKLDRGLEVIERNAKAQTRLIGDLLDVSRIISGKLQLDLSTVELYPLLLATTDVVRPAAEAKGVRLVVDIDPSIGDTTADPDRLQQIVWNLLTNAIRFTPRAGRVTITCDRMDSRIKIAVTDSGAGLATQDLSTIFERFKQVDSSTTRAHGGLGLGLAIVRHLVEAHGGTVEATSAGLGHGSTFAVLLPVAALSFARPRTSTTAADGSTVAAAPPTDEGWTTLDGLRLLIVDDEGDSLEMLRELLTAAGGQVTCATSAREALAAMDASGPFDLVVSDVGMPEIDGYGFIRRVRARTSGADVPAIALTAYARVADTALVLDAGFQEHIVKPVDSRRLVRAIKTWSRA